MNFISTSLFYHLQHNSNPRLSQNVLFSVPCLLFWLLHVPQPLFAYGLELLLSNAAPGPVSITAYEIERRAEQLGGSGTLLLNTNECFPVSAM